MNLTSKFRVTIQFKVHYDCGSISTHNRTVKVDLKPLIIHRLPLKDAGKGF